MLAINRKIISGKFALLSLLLWCTACPAASEIDKTRYITVDEIRPEMPAYCLTVYEGTNVEKFDMQVISVLYDFRPGHNLILVKGTDPRFIHTGPVGGCSGSPLYIDGRLAGALSRAWFYSKDPLYGATPIEEMLTVGREGSASDVSAQPAFALDFSKPLDLAGIYKQITTAEPLARKSYNGGACLPIPLITSGLPAEAAEPLKSFLEPFGFITVAGPAGGSGPGPPQEIDFKPGAVLTVPLVTGDIKLTTFGAVTDVVGDKLYGFGHAFLGYGKINLPMATGQINTVVASLLRSFKIGDALEIKGTITSDESTAIYGQIGTEPKMMPMKIKIDRYNDTQKVYNCRVAVNQLLTPLLVNAALAGAALTKGSFPPDHFIRYKVDIDTDRYGRVSFQNVSTGQGLAELTTHSVAPVALLMNNPFKTIDITSIDADLQIVPENILAHIWSVDLSDSKVKPGRSIDVCVIIESWLSRKKTYKYKLQIPENLPPGSYDLTISGAAGYEKFLRKAAPYRFTAEDMPSLIDALKNIAAVRRDRLYFVLALPPGGLTIQNALLPDLPASKAIVLTDAKRTLETMPYEHWLEDDIGTGSVIIDKKTVRITVEK